jgi:ribonuclease P protein component
MDVGSEVRVSTAVSKRTRNAVKRNRLRRRLRHAVLEAQRRRVWQSGLYLIIPKESADSASYTELVTEVSQLSEWLVGRGSSDLQGAR